LLRISIYAGLGDSRVARFNEAAGNTHPIKKETPMAFHASRRLVAPLFSFAALTLLSFTASAADTAPDKPVGLTGLNDAVALVDLGQHNLANPTGDYDLRARTIGIAPGGAIHAHPHAGRPGIVRVIKGTVIEYRGTTERTLKAGDSWFENVDTVHWFRNPSSTEAAEIWAVDLVAKKK
jgi:quercetin dioxygenase-like cupin family protein